MKFLILVFTLKKIPLVSWSSYDALNLKPKFITLLYLILGLILFEEFVPNHVLLGGIIILIGLFLILNDSELENDTT